MLTTRLLLPALLGAILAAGEPGLAVTPLGPARTGGLLRVAVEASALPPSVLALSLLADDGDVLAEAAGELSGDGRAVLVLATPLLADGRLRLRATATWRQPGQAPGAVVAEVPVDSPAAALAAASATIARLRASGSADPLPWLWAEQIAELREAGASAASVGAVGTLTRRLDSWLDHPAPPAARPGLIVLAMRDAVDDSVQPLRLHLPPGSGPHPFLVLLGPAPAAGKSRWSGSDATLIDAALAAGLAVVDCYPAGDRTWSGAARRRIPAAIDAAAAIAPLDRARGACLGQGRGDGLPYALHAPSTPPDRLASLPGPPLVAAPGDGWADAPFAIVVGSAEHIAAAAANRRLGESLRAAYAAHAHAVVPLRDDRTAPGLLAGRNLVLIGNPRSNRLLATLVADLPWSWDHREVRHRDGRRHLRATQPFVSASARLPDGRRMLVIDGPPPDWGEGLPLAE